MQGNWLVTLGTVSAGVASQPAILRPPLHLVLASRPWTLFMSLTFLSSCDTYTFRLQVEQREALQIPHHV